MGHSSTMSAPSPGGWDNTVSIGLQALAVLGAGNIIAIGIGAVARWFKRRGLAEAAAAQKAVEFDQALANIADNGIRFVVELLRGQVQQALAQHSECQARLHAAEERIDTLEQTIRGAGLAVPPHAR